MTDDTFSTLFDRCRAERPRSKPFLVVDGKTMTYGALLDRIDRLFRFFETTGLRPGDRIAVVTTSSPDLADLMLAGLRYGLAVCPLNTELAVPERRNALRCVDPAHIFIDGALVTSGALPGGVPHTAIEADHDQGHGGGLLGRLLTGRNTASGPRGLAAELEALSPAEVSWPVDPEQTGLMLFTSGTTNAPKVVQLSQKNLYAQINTFLNIHDYDAECHILNLLPLHHADGIMHGPIIAFFSGATLFRPRRFTVQELGDILHSVYRDRITHFIVVPALLSIMDRLSGEFDDAFRTKDFRFIRSSADHLPESLWASIERRFATRVTNTYGLSETVCEALYCGPLAERFKIGTLGKPVDCEIKIVDDRGEPVADGQTGELMIRGDNIMQGYFRQPDLTAEVLIDGWFRTGDFVSQDQDGFVHFVGRKKTLIITGGINVHPQDVTDALLDHPDVVEAVTFALPDRIWGEIVASAVVTARSVQLDAADLIKHCRERLAPNKVPRLIKKFEKLPRNPTGKILVDDIKRDVEADQVGNPARIEGNLEQKILAIAAHCFGCEPADLSLNVEHRTTFGWDSLAHVNLMLMAESVFEITLSPRDILSVSRLDHLKTAVANRLAEKQNG